MSAVRSFTATLAPSRERAIAIAVHIPPDLGSASIRVPVQWPVEPRGQISPPVLTDDEIFVADYPSLVTLRTTDQLKDLRLTSRPTVDR